MTLHLVLLHDPVEIVFLQRQRVDTLLQAAVLLLQVLDLDLRQGQCAALVTLTLLQLCQPATSTLKKHKY